MQEPTVNDGAAHILNWIESSSNLYERLLHISRPGNFMSDINRAHVCTMLASIALQAMIKSGEAHMSNHCAGSILRAAVMISEWKEPN